MNFEQDNEKPIIYIEEKPEVIEEQGEGETPLIVIEREKEVTTRLRDKRWPWAVGACMATALCCLLVWLGWRYYRTYINIGIRVSVSSAENIAKLKATDQDQVTPEVVLTSDSVLGVAMNFYEIRGLKAEISMQEPDTTDTDVYLYSRCSDYHPDFSIIGSLVVDGQEKETVGNRRLGYFAAANDNMVIGIARDEDVKEYVKKNRGCFFRQFILLSAGEIPGIFHLHGKVERRAIGRKPSGKLYYIETKHKETMWDFADALREYGFVDAIYITGGYDYCFYRTADGVRHDISNQRRYPHQHSGKIPWLVFRKR